MVLTWFGLEKAYPDIASMRYFPDSGCSTGEDRWQEMIRCLGLETVEVPWQLIVAKLLVTGSERFAA